MIITQTANYETKLSANCLVATTAFRTMVPMVRAFVLRSFVTLDSSTALAM